MHKKIPLFIIIVSVLTIAGTWYFADITSNNQSSQNKTWPEALREYLGTPEYENINPEKPVEKQTSIFEIAGRTFEMPKVYIQTNLGSKKAQDGVNLLYVMPDFTSRADFKNKQEYEQAKADRRFAHMLIQNGSSKPPFDTMISNRRRHLAKEEYIGVFEGLEHYRWYKNSPDGAKFRHEIYLEKSSEGELLSFIECSTMESGAHIRFPGCNHRFRDNALFYNIYYNKKNYLLSWKKQRRAAIEFIDSFEVTAPP